MRKFKSAIFSVLLSVVLGTACSANLSDAEHVARAEALLREGKMSAASIELKSALQKAPDNAQARLLLGQVMAETGDLFAAEKEFSEALSLGADPNEVVPPLSRVLQALQNHKELDLLSRAGLSSTASAELLASKGLAELAKGNLGPADGLIKEAAALDRGSLYVQLAQAQLAMSLDTHAKARTLIAAALKTHPDSAQAFNLLAQIEWREGNLEQAVSDFGEAIAKQPNNKVVFQLNRALVNLQLGRYEDVEKDAPDLNMISKNSPGASYVLGVLEHHKGNYKDALTALEIARWDQDTFPLSVFFSASSHLALGNLQQADLYSSEFVKISPDNVAGRKLLAVIRQQQANYSEVIELLTPVVNVYGDDIIALDLLALALLHNGEKSQAIDLYEKLVQLQPESPIAQFNLGNALLAAGNTDLALAAIKKATALDPAFEQAQELLIFAHLQTRQNEEAIGVAENFRNANPGLAASHNLLGRVLLATGKTKKARESFEKSCQIDPGNPLACGKLAELATSRKDLEKAQDYYQMVLEHNQNHLGTLVDIASLNVLQDDAKNMLIHLQQAVDSHPEAEAPRLVLARYYLLKGRPEKVGPLLEPLDKTGKKTPDALRVYASAQIMQEQFEAARYTLEELIKQEPERADSYVSLAKVHAQLKDAERTKEALIKALELNPQHFAARLALARMYLREGDKAGVEVHLVVLRETAAKQPDVIELESSLAQLQGDQQRSLALSEQALEVSDTYPRMMAVARQKQAMGDKEGAFKLLESWTLQHPNDVPAQISLTMAYAKMGKLEEAIQGYERVLKLDENNVMALNDIAWHMRTRNKEQALLYAKRAFELEPESAGILDTLAMVYLENGKVAEALTVIGNAIEKAPGEPTLLYHQAIIMAADGDTRGALNVLDKLAARNIDFSEKEAALALRAEISSKI